MTGALHWLSGFDSPPQPACSEINRTAEEWARAGLSLGPLLRACWIERTLLWERVMAQINAQVTERNVLDLYMECDRRLCRWADAVTREFIDRYTASEPMNGARRRLSVLREIIGGASADSASLGYELGRYHLALIAWGDGAKEVPDRVADALGRQVLVAQPEAGVVWAWLGGPRELSAREDRRLDSLELTASAAVSFGDCLPAIGGFRTSHLQARNVMRVARDCSLQVSRYHELALEALITQNARSAQLFVDREFGALYGGERAISGDDERSRRLRETLDAYFQAGSRLAGAAALLGVTDETISNRLRRIEERLGVTILDRQGELQAALRARKVLKRTT